MIIFDQITEANRIEHLENLLKVTQITLESVTEQRDEVRADLEFRRGLFQLQEQQLNDVRAERDGLGRDLSAVKEQRDTAQKALFSAVDDYEKAIEQRDRLAEALWSMLNQDDMSAIRAGILLRSLGLQSPTNTNEL